MRLDPASLARMFGDRTAIDGSLVRDNFARWFGHSKVVANGAPLRLYHGTSREFTSYYTRREGAHFGTAEQANDRVRKAWDARLMPVYLSICSPVELRDLNTWGSASVADELLRTGVLSATEVLSVTSILDLGHGGVAAWKRLKSILAERGHDGISYLNTQEGAAPATSYIAFAPAQIKSAIGNSGLFDPQSEDIVDAHGWDSFVDRQAWGQSCDGPVALQERMVG